MERVCVRAAQARRLQEMKEVKLDVALQCWLRIAKPRREGSGGAQVRRRQRFDEDYAYWRVGASEEGARHHE